MSSKSIIEIVKKFIKASRFQKVLEKVKIVEIGGGNLLAELKIDEEHTNEMGNLHEGYAATLADTLTTGALVTHENCGIIPNVSISLNMRYFKAAAQGDEIVIDSNTEKVGKTLAYMKTEMRNKSTGELLVTGTHTKYLLRNRGDIYLEVPK